MTLDEMMALLVGAAPGDIKEEIVNVADQLIERGRQQGLREFLLEQLTTRFGALPQAAITRVSAAGPAELKRWGLRVLTASTLADVLDTP